jgi:hypothetical protein
MPFLWIGAVFIGAASHISDGRGTDPILLRLSSLSLVISALSIFLIARYRDRRPRKVKDKDSGRVFIVPHCDELWFLRLKYWPFIYIAIAVGCLIRSYL